jgi:hypothetical protein
VLANPIDMNPKETRSLGANAGCIAIAIILALAMAFAAFFWLKPPKAAGDKTPEAAPAPASP